MVHHFFCSNLNNETFKLIFEVFLKTPQTNTTCGQPDLNYPLLTDLVSVAQVWRLTSPCCFPVAYSWIIHASVAVPHIYFSIYSISFCLASREKDVLSASCGHFLNSTSPFSQSLFLSVPSSFNDVFHHVSCVTKYFFSWAQKCLSLPHSSSRDPLRPPRLGPDAKACRRAHRSRGKPGATLAPEHQSRSPCCWHS